MMFFLSAMAGLFVWVCMLEGVGACALETDIYMYLGG